MKVVGSAQVPLQELEALLVDIKAIINSCPLTYVGSEPSDRLPLTPAKLLVGRSLTTGQGQMLPALDALHRLIRHKARITDQWWDRWRNEYLTTLASQDLWFAEGKAPAVGELVLVSEDNVKRGRWPTGMIEEVIAGRDGAVRAVQVRIRGKSTRRPIQRIHRFEIREEAAQ